MTTPTFERRKANLELLIEKEAGGNVSAFCKTHSLDPGYIWQLLNDRRSFGEKSARNIEQKAGLSEHYLDRTIHADELAFLAERKASRKRSGGQNAEIVVRESAKSYSTQQSDHSVSEFEARHIFGGPKTNLIKVKSLAQIINRERGSAEVSAPDTLPDQAVAYVLENDTMEGPQGKYIPRNSTLYIVETDEPVPGKVVLASLNGAEVIGEYSMFAGRPHLRPFNQQYPIIDITGAKIGGTLVGVYWKF